MKTGSGPFPFQFTLSPLRWARKWKYFLTILVWLSAPLIGSSAAGAAGFDLYGLAVYPMGVGNPIPERQASFPGVGGIFHFDLADKLGMEVGANYMQTNYIINTQQVDTRIVSVFGGIRAYFSRYLYLAGGGYSNSYLNNPLDTTARDYGIYMSLGVYIPMGSQTSIFISPTYQTGLSTLNYGRLLNLTPIQAVIAAAVLLKPTERHEIRFFVTAPSMMRMMDTSFAQEVGGGVPTTSGIVGRTWSKPDPTVPVGDFLNMQFGMIHLFI